MKPVTKQLLLTQKGVRFWRVLGGSLRISSPSHIRGGTKDQLGLFCESFGPAEIRKMANGKFIFWNFVREDGRSGFVLFSRAPEIRKPKASIGRLEAEVLLAAKTSPRSFKNWTATRMFAVESGTADMPMLGSAQFVASKIN